jgi:signal recognition particle receptor subunit beta
MKMVVFNYSGSEINAKIVYYGPALGGKTTNLEQIYEHMPSDAKGKMVSMKTRTDRTLFFDFLPIELGAVSGFRTRMLLYTVPGQVYYNATRKLVLKGADALVFVADSDPAKLKENIESLRNLEENLNEHDLTLDSVPWVIQYNKRDLPDALPLKTLEAELNLLDVPSFEAVATQGIGIYETFQVVAGMLYNQLAERLDRSAEEPSVLPTAEPTPVSPDARAAATLEQAAQAPVDAPIPMGPKALRAHDIDASVSDALDSALREVDESAPTATAVRPPATAGAGEHRFARATPDARKEPEDDAFRFESLEEGRIDDDVGRVIDLEDTPNEPIPPSTPPEPAGEFITNPWTTTGQRRVEATENRLESFTRGVDVAADEPVAKPPDRQEPDSEDECVITVPVLLTRSQIRKTIPIKLALEIQVVDDDL